MTFTMKRDGRKLSHKTLEEMRLMAIQRMAEGEAPGAVAASSKSGQFAYSEELSELTLTNLGFFEVDSAGKRLKTSSKSGCCYHKWTVWAVEQNVPVAVQMHIEDFTLGIITDQRLVKGKWKKTVRRAQMEE